MGSTIRGNKPRLDLKNKTHSTVHNTLLFVSYNEILSSEVSSHDTDNSSLWKKKYCQTLLDRIYSLQ